MDAGSVDTGLKGDNYHIAVNIKKISLYVFCMSRKSYFQHIVGTDQCYIGIHVSMKNL